MTSNNSPYSPEGDRKKEISTFAYVKDALKSIAGKRVIVTFDIIELVSESVEFMVDASQLLNKNGRAYSINLD